jgi:dihydroneopterin aldolase
MPNDSSDEAPQRHTVISVSGIEVFGFHGVLEQERTHGVRLTVDVEVSCRFADGSRDALDETVDYRHLERTVRAVNRSSQYTLIESFANAIAGELMSSDKRLASVTVRVSKLEPDGMARGVTPTVTIMRERS